MSKQGLMRKLEASLREFKQLGIPACLTGSAALIVLSDVAESRGQPRLVDKDRVPGDLDYLSTSQAFYDAAQKLNFRTRHDAGIRNCINIDVGQSHYELTEEWPHLLVDTRHSLESVSVDVGGLLVMLPGAIASQKAHFRRPKDLRDLQQLHIALGLEPFRR